MGNGRHARILADALLTKILNEPPINWSKGYDLQAMSMRRKEYITALRAADHGNFQPLLEFAK
jgi:fido (protein-threonine AMPylation protein)